MTRGTSESTFLPPALLHRLIVLAGARTRIGRLGVPIALEKEAEAVVAPVVAASATATVAASSSTGQAPLHRRDVVRRRGDFSG